MYQEIRLYVLKVRANYALHWAWLLLGWVTVGRQVNHLGM